MPILTFKDPSNSPSGENKAIRMEILHSSFFILHLKTFCLLLANFIRKLSGFFPTTHQSVKTAAPDFFQNLTLLKTPLNFRFKKT